ncbi:NHL repeat-containing protein [Alienimonas californiensis]|uniref:Arylsulfotransferase (ASST) n=1 Tax=Alienimonas californiensis TaxID=2527989 RepID=A0A517PB92_9PLAN|nr:hypothetical protein [Alienimonas californiensis]QDT16654.1 hypothetical protein CA12_27600 [Alienimonas californiensis]
MTRAPLPRPVRRATTGAIAAAVGVLFAVAPAPAAESEVTHSFLAFGKTTCRVDETGESTPVYPASTRDGYELPDGTLVLTLSRSRSHPGGAVVEVAPGGAETVLWEGTQSEVNGAQPTDAGTVVLTEAGERPRLLEVDREGTVLVEFPLVCQTENHHLQTRMARKLADGTYLVPHLLDFAVVQYDAEGRVLKRFDTTLPGDENRSVHTWPFTAIRHGDGRTLVCCTNGNRVMDFDADGNVVWTLSNEDLPGPWLQDPCGGQVLPNGNVVVTSYAAGRRNAKAPKLFEVTPDKEVVWTYRDGRKVGIHHFQILTNDGERLAGPPMK